MIVNNKGLVLLNTITLVLMLFFNYASSTGLFSGVTVGEVSHMYNTLFAPADYAFIIWSLIFLLCLSFVAHQWYLLKTGDPRLYIKRTGVWFTVSNIANAAWLHFWTSQMLGWSVILIFILLISLCFLTVRLRLELDDEPVRTIFFVWWPVTFYLGWIAVATIACVAAWLVSMDWFGGAFGEDIWAIIMVVIAGFLYLFMVVRRNLRETAAVGIWAFIAIAVRHWSLYNNIAITAITAAIILFVAIAVHGYKRRNYSPFAKIKRGEWN